MDARRRLAAVLGLIAALVPGASYAQTQEPMPPVEVFPRWEDMPDLVQYLSVTVPQCTSPNGNQLGIRRIQPVVTWSELGSVIAWLSWQIENTQVAATCWTFAALQHMANILVTIGNALLLGVNATYRALLLGLLDIRGLALWAWYGIELLRSQWWTAEDMSRAAQNFLSWLAQAFLAVLTFIGQFIAVVVRITGAIVGMLGWLLGFVGSLIGEALQATTWTPTGQQLAIPPTPAPLSSTSTIYCALRGALDGIHDSQFGWALYLGYALAYVGFVYWASRFFSGERSSS